MKSTVLLVVTCCLAGPLSAADTLALTVRASSNRRGVVTVGLRLTVSHQGAYTCTMPLPNEIVPFHGLSFNLGRAKYTPKKRQDSNLGPLTTAAFEVLPDVSGMAEGHYDVSLGGQMASSQEGRLGPHYGFLDDDHTVFSSSLITPHCVPQGEADAPDITVFPKVSSDISGLPIVPIVRDSTIFTQGRLVTTIVSNGMVTVHVHSFRPLEVKTREYLQAMLTVMQPLLSHGDVPIPDIVALRDDTGDTYYPLSEPRAIVTDVEPLTPERGLRLSRVFAAQAISNQLQANLSVPAEELWLLYALPAYYALKTAGKQGLVPEEKLVYEQREAYNLAKVSYDALGQLYREPDPAQRDVIAYSLGVPLLYDLDRQLRRLGSTLDSVVRHTHFGSRIFAFRNSLAFSLGPIAAYRWWQRQIRSSDPEMTNTTRLTLQPRPELGEETEPLLLLTGGTTEHLELCGCKRNQAGGAARRQYFVDHSPGTRIELGNFMANPTLRVSGTVDQLEAKAQLAMMAAMKYSAIALGSNEWLFLDRLDENASVRDLIVSANTGMFAPFRLVSIDEATVAVVGWSDMPPLQRFESRSWMAIARHGVSFDTSRLGVILESLSRRGLPVILIGEIHPLTILAVLNRFDNIQMVLSSYTGAGPLSDGSYRGRYVMFYSGDEGATVLKVMASKRSGTVSRAIAVRMSTALREDRRARAWLDTFFNSDAYRTATLADEQVKGHETATAVGVTSIVADSSFVGSDRCQHCHEAEFQQWMKTGHATAMKSLVQKHRDHVAACVACHVIAFRQQSGYSLIRPTLSLQNVGCEVCHGQGLLHTEHPSTTNIRRAPDKALCGNCHTPEHSNYVAQSQQYWAKVYHNGQTRAGQ